MGLKVGQLIPQFALHDADGMLFQSNELSGKKSYVIFFYPKNYSHGCKLEVCSFKDSFEEPTELGALVTGIRSDFENTHHRFASKYRLPFKLSVDKHKRI